PQERGAEERRPPEVEGARAVGGEPGGQTTLDLLLRHLPPVLVGPRDLDPAPHHLERPLEALPGERRAEGRVAGHDPLPGADEGVDVEGAGELGDQVLEVEPRARRVEALEEHALLERREWIDVLDRAVEAGALAGERVERRRIEAGERDVGRREASRGRREAV